MAASDRPKSHALRDDLAGTRDNGKYVLRLYVTGQTPKSGRAIGNLKRICEQHLPGRYELEVIDLYQQPELAKDQQIIAAPTLVKELPEPVKRILGDMSNEERVLAGLDVRRTNA